MIDKHLRRYFPDFSPEQRIPVRSGKNLDFLDALLWEFGLEELALYVTDFERMMREVIPFMKYRGSLYAMRLSLAWVGVPDPKIVRLSRTRYEIDPGFMPNEVRLKAIQSACRYSAPARATLSRIFHGDFEEII